MLVERKEVLNEDKSTGYIEAVFNSDNVLKTTYFPHIQRLYIAFSRGHTYSYGNISRELYDEFEASDSQGKFFHKEINNKLKTSLLDSSPVIQRDAPSEVAILPSRVWASLMAAGCACRVFRRATACRDWRRSA